MSKIRQQLQRLNFSTIVEKSKKIFSIIEEEINELKTNSVYNTQETVIGTWVTGETIYRKVILFTDSAIAVGSNYEIVHNLNIKDYLKSEVVGVSMSFSGGIVEYANSMQFIDENAGITFNENSIIVGQKTNDEVNTIYVILEYTK